MMSHALGEKGCKRANAATIAKLAFFVAELYWRVNNFFQTFFKSNNFL